MPRFSTIATIAGPIVALALCLTAHGAQAQTQADPHRGAGTSASIVDEVRFGLLAHDPSIGGSHREDGVDVNGELYFHSPHFLEILLKPRPAIGVTVNTSGNTSAAFATLAWTYSITANRFGAPEGLFAEVELGAAVHDGKLSNSDPTRKALGSRALFHEAISIGYEYLPQQNVSIYIDHMSNAGITQRNAGLTDLGMRLGWSF